MNPLFIRALITEKCMECVSFKKCMECNHKDKQINYFIKGFYTTPSGEVALFNAEQSSTDKRLTASRAIDGDWYTRSVTVTATGTHWWQVSMTKTTVYQIVLRARTGYSVITVSLYSGETLAGQCKSHTGSHSTETLSCDRVTADRVRLAMSSTSSTTLKVYEIKVPRVPTITIGLYLVSARIVSVSRQLVCIWYQPEL